MDYISPLVRVSQGAGGGGGGRGVACSIDPLKISLFLLRPKCHCSLMFFDEVPFNGTDFSCFQKINPKNFPCSPEINYHVPLFPKIPGGPSLALPPSLDLRFHGYLRKQSRSRLEINVIKLSSFSGL